MSIERISTEYNADGTWTQTGFQDDKLIIRHESDVSAAVEYATKLRNSDDYSRQGIKNGFWHIATLPTTIVLRLKEIGVDIYAPKCSGKEIVAGLRKINAEHFLTTAKRV
jgi:hypothetical protein